MNFLEIVHGRLIFKRRARVLSGLIAAMIPPNAKVLDAGCGDGLISSLIQEKRPDVTLAGMDILIRPKTHIPVARFDGETFPFGDESFDVVMFVDVLHHAAKPMALLREARRVTRRWMLIKDHCKDGFLAEPTLKLMDWVGNARHGVVLPYRYWPETRWGGVFDELGLKRIDYTRRTGLYPMPLSWLFERRLNFVALLEKTVVSEQAKPIMSHARRE